MAYQMMKGKKGNNDGFPSIPGMIARYSGAGLTNEDMSTNPVWKDLMGNGYDLQMKNFGWAGMSGVNGYVENFNQWFVGFDESNKTVSDSSMKLVLLESDSQKVIYDRHSHQIGYTYNFYIKVTGIEGRTLNVNAGTLGGTIMSITEDGIYSINATVSDSWGNNMLYLIFPPSSSNNTVTIEQLPLYPGAIVFDRVDDYGVCENFPILTKEKGYTVVALRQYLVDKSTAYLTANGDSISNTSFILEGNHYRDTWNFGKVTPIQASRILATQTSKQYNGVKLNIGTNTEGSNLLQVGKWRRSYSNVAIWELVFLDHDATEEELTKIKDYFVKTYPWLFPDQAWTVTGKTNEDEDRATIANITGNGNNLVLSNFGFAEGSGYNEQGEYAGYLVTDGVDDIASSNTIIYEADFTFIGEWKFIQKDDTVAGINSSSHLYIQNRYNRGATVMINSTFENKKNITDYMTFKAITSKGKAYDENWNEVDLLYGDGNKGPSGVNIGGQGGTEFCHMIFKNMALYMNKVFSKDDCIKAYNYLQTLKAK
jgi:hypothetical protein